MPDHEVTEGDITLEGMARAIGQMKAENARLEARLGELEARDRSDDGPAGRDKGAGGVPSTAVEPAHEELAVSQVVSRRGAFKVLGAAAAGGVGVALGSAIVSAEPAAATTGTMMFGTDNFAGSDETTLNAVTTAGAVTFQARNDGAGGHALYGEVTPISGIAPTPGSAVVGDTNGTNSPGVEGLSGFGSGVHGVAGSSTGSLAFEGHAGVSGESTDGTGVAGVSISGSGVAGLTYNNNLNAGVHGHDSSDGGFGVWGSSDAGIGGFFEGGFDGAPLRLGLAATTGSPTGTGHFAGEVYVDTDGAIFYCYVGDGTTSEWVGLTNGTFPIPPVRVINTADGTGGITGPLVPGSTVHTSSAIAGTHGIPAAAVGVVGNLAISGVSGALLNGVGFATLFPAGEATPATANINAGAGCFAISNAVTVGLGTGGSNAGKLSLVWSGGGPVPHAEAYFDVTGYIL